MNIFHRAASGTADTLRLARPAQAARAATPMGAGPPQQPTVQRIDELSGIVTTPR
jgi:hypothetical protein